MCSHANPGASLVILVLALVPTPVFADPPVLNYFFPAGAQRGTTAKITAGGTFKSWPVKIWTSRPDIKFESAKARGKLKVTVAPGALPGICWVRFYNEDGASALRPFVIGSLEQELEKEPNNELRDSQFLKASSIVVNGKLASRGDVDVFALELQESQTLVASMEAEGTLKSPMDAVLQVLSEGGFVLEQNDDWRGMDPQIIFQAPRNGRYYVRTFAFPSTPNSSISFSGADNYIYRLTLTTGGFADHAFPLAVSDNSSEKVRLIGWNIPPAAKEVTVVVEKESGTGSAFHPQVANPVQIRLESHTTLAESKPNNSSKPQSVPIPSTISGHISSPGESDVYEFHVSKGQKLQAIIEASTLLSPLDPVLILKEKNGKIIQRGQAKAIGQDPELTISANSATTYTIEVKDLHDRGGMPYFYRLRLVPLRGDFSLKVAKDRFVVSTGKPLEIPVTIERKNGFNKEIEIAAQELPKGIVAAPVSASAKSKTVKLIVKGEGESISGSFRIVGQVKDAADQIRIAQATAAELGSVTNHLWITLTNKKESTPKKK